MLKCDICTQSSVHACEKTSCHSISIHQYILCMRMNRTLIDFPLTIEDS